ncbi:MAG: APC family permease, partial [bacterium]|nr:APC family permease [bacterium]
LAIFGADSLSSTAYATEEILLALGVIGASAYAIAVPVAGVIALLILLVAVSYRQAIHAYPQGGGVYNVARENLGELPALVGAASLLIDYVLTTAVSTAAGIAAITSAFPALFPHRVAMGIVIIIFLTWVNLRGVRESGKLFTIPTYAFIAAFFALIGYGVWRHVMGTFPVLAPPVDALVPSTGMAVGVLLMLRAFASGCTAMTGIEATSNGVPAFQSPAAKNASATLMRMAFLLGGIFLGITLLAFWGRVAPAHDETIVSQIARGLFGGGIFYYIVQASTALILLLAANTPFAGFPRVASQLAIDEYFPRQFANLGSRLVFTNGIILLSAFAALLLYVFDGNVHALIPLYAVGVFLGFSLSQLGMIRHGLRERRRRWWPIVVNGVGAVATSIVLVIVFTSKFSHGAWVLIPAILAIVAFMLAVHRHYRAVTRSLALTGAPVPDVLPDKTMVLFVARVDRAMIHAVKFAKSFAPEHLRAFHVAFSEREAADIREQWKMHVRDVPLDVVVSEYRDLVGSILTHMKSIERRWKDDSIIVVIPEYVPKKVWQFFLHDQIPFRIRLALEQDPDIHVEILNVPAKVAAHLT